MRLPEAYFQTWFRVESDGPRPKRFGVVTAYHPNGKTASAAKNRAADRRLRLLLEQRKVPHARVTGGNKEGTHREPGWGFAAASPKDVRALARRFRQKAYFWIAGNTIYLGASSGGPLVRAGQWTARRARWRP
jgi:hypothetical protein